VEIPQLKRFVKARRIVLMIWSEDEKDIRE